MTYKRTDANQAAIVSELREIGASVLILASVGSGCPDLLVGWKGNNYLFELKNLAGRGNRLTPAETIFLTGWKGQAAIVCNLAAILAILEAT